MIEWIIIILVFIVTVVISYRLGYYRGFRDGGLFSDIRSSAEQAVIKHVESKSMDEILSQVPLVTNEEQCEKH